MNINYDREKTIGVAMIQRNVGTSISTGLDKIGDH